MWANAEITTQTYGGFIDSAYNWVYTDSAGFHIENHPNGNIVQGFSWQFNATGNLILPAGGTIGEGSAVIFGGSPVHTIELTPYGGGNPDQRLVIYPTAGEGNHLHLTSGNLLVTDIFLGDDTQFVKTNADGSMSIGTNVGQYGIGGNTWTFDNAGNLTLPDGGSILSNNNLTIQTSEIIYLRSTSVGGVGIYSGNSQLAVTSGVGIETYADAINFTPNAEGDVLIDINNANTFVAISSPVGSWMFGHDGTTTFPSNTIHTNNDLTIQASGIPDTVTAITYSTCLLYTSPSPRDRTRSRMPSSA